MNVFFLFMFSALFGAFSAIFYLLDPDQKVSRNADPHPHPRYQMFSFETTVPDSPLPQKG